MEILNYCWQFHRCEEMKFLIVCGDKIIGAASYQDILYSRDFKFYCLYMNENVFLEARNYFESIGADEYAVVPVLAENGDCVCLMEWQKTKKVSRRRNTLDSLPLIHYRNYLKNPVTLDMSIFEKKDVAIIGEIEEYTKFMIDLLLSNFRNIKVISLDKRYDWFWTEAEITYCMNLNEASQYTNGKSFVYIYTKIIMGDLDEHIYNSYDSYRMMKSLLWASNHICYGNANMGKTILLIDCLTFGTQIVGLENFNSGLCEYHEILLYLYPAGKRKGLCAGYSAGQVPESIPSE